MKTITTPDDVIKFAVLPLTTSPCNFRELAAIEEDVLTTCLTEKLYRAMLEAVVCYDDIPAYEATTDYVAGDQVYYQGTYREATENGAGVPSGAGWKDVARFTGECAQTYEKLTCEFLAPYVAQIVARERLPVLLEKLGNTRGEEDSAGGRKAKYDRYNSMLESSADRYRNRLIRYLRDQERKNDPCLAEYYRDQIEHAHYGQHEGLVCGCKKRGGCSRCAGMSDFYMRVA